MGLKLITGATAPLTAADLRLHCSIDSSDATYDGLLVDYIAAASGLIEEMTGRALGAQVWELKLDRFADEIELPKGPVTGISFVKYLDVNRAEQTLSASNYIADLVSDPQRLVRDPQTSWPETASNYPNAVTVRFQTGYADVPPTILQAIRATVATWFATREAVALPDSVAAALAPWRSQWIFA